MLAGKVKAATRVIVPFLDLANHDPRPNVDYRCEGGDPRALASARSSEKRRPVRLAALRDVDAGEELRLSYAGES